ncbi:MAG TPA: LacI family transcriptional regulator [Caldithrix abyssi]|uniref:LacI family transcriptional regulator n=1 Tax=Caldithrix abyssi TaxID=187145 RepID=A0A7V5LIN8_CALAY|nr:LacI family transcriptional regulator [Caldithrix abyssi]
MNDSKRTTLKIIAEKTGVSVTTVSRVLNGQATRYRISKETSEKIYKCAKELHYTPDSLARGLRLKRTHIIGLIIPDISNPFFATIAYNIEVEARKAGYSIMLCDSEENTELEIESIKLLQSRKVDGLLICPVGQKSEHLERLHNEGIPLVIVDRYFPDLPFSYVVSDNYNGAKAAVEYLIENGHKKIACIQGLLNTRVNDDRVRGYKDAHIKHGLTIDETLIVGDSFGEKNGYIGAKLILSRSSPTAIFAASNLIALGSLRAISEEGFKIPDDISIISFDDQPYTEYLATPLTTIAQPHSEMGQIAVKLIIEQIESKGNFNPVKLKLPTKLIKRKSVKRLS